MPDDLFDTGGAAERDDVGTTGATGTGSSADALGGTGSAGLGSLSGATGTPPGDAGASSLATSGSDEAAASAAAMTSLRDAARGAGFQGLERFTDDHSFLQHLLLQAQQAQQYQHQLQQAQQLAGYGRKYLQHAQPFEQYLEQQKRAQQAQQTKDPWFKAPEYDPAWRARLTRDPQTGEIRAVPGAPPDLVGKYLSAVEHRENFLDKFAFDPIGAIKPGVEEVVRQIAQEIVEQQLGSYQSTQTSRQILQQNAEWLYERDQHSGRPVYNQNGQPQLSQAGQVYYGHLQRAAQMGFQNDQQAHEYAYSMLQRDLALAQLKQLQGKQGQAPQQAQAPQQSQSQQQTPQQQGEDAKNGFLQRAAGNAAGGKRRPGHGAGNAAGAPSGEGRSLVDSMRSAFKAAGVTDQHIKDSLSGRR